MVKIIIYIVYALLGIALSIGAPLYLKKKSGLTSRRIRDGITVYVLFSALINSVVYAVISVSMGLEEKISQSIWTYAFVNALLIIVFTALGRFVWIKFLIKKDGGKDDAMLFGAGYAATYTVFAYVISAVSNAIICGIAYYNSEAEISSVFSSNISQIQNIELYSLFMQIVQMVLMFVFETAISVVFYKSLLCEDKKKWLFAGILVHFAGSFVIRCTQLDVGVNALILLAVTIVSAGMAHHLAFNNEKNSV